jgi:hypothetical protein
MPLTALQLDPLQKPQVQRGDVSSARNRVHGAFKRTTPSRIRG